MCNNRITLNFIYRIVSYRIAQQIRYTYPWLT